MRISQIRNITFGLVGGITAFIGTAIGIQKINKSPELSVTEVEDSEIIDFLNRVENQPPLFSKDEIVQVKLSLMEAIEAMTVLEQSSSVIDPRMHQARLKVSLRFLSEFLDEKGIPQPDNLISLNPETGAIESDVAIFNQALRDISAEQGYSPIR